MEKEEAIRFAGLMEEYLNIPSFICESIEKDLINNKYKEVIKYIIQRRNEIENKENYKSEQDIIKSFLELQQRINKAIEYYETYKQECVIGRNKDEKLIKEYYLPAQCSKKLMEILKGE